MILTDLISENYNKLNKNDLKIYSYILLDKKRFLGLNISELAEALDLVPSSIVSFSKKLGLDGYSELRYIVKWSGKESSGFDDNEIEYSKNDLLLTMTMMISLNLDELFKKLDKANRIYAMASGYTQKNAADELKRNFLIVDKIVYVIDKNIPSTILNNIKEDDVLFVLSLSGENKEVLRFLNKLPSRPTVASITRLSNNTLSKRSDVNIPFVTHRVFEYDSRTEISPISQFYVVIDFIILKYLSYKEKNTTIDNNI
ncbi:MurR/RpiR family transcriptional regulator [uncultured Anaerococcus sp.]|uniref:MurR/RpiR family transcriptional regulator n=1 Tax=uncultured Anaerococcus sp. TaxID=293428 RepID=UPI0025EADBFD|nr:MurR/RpiR family transcriptional regulator [uncultured Anaerococcus sp.]